MATGQAGLQAGTRSQASRSAGALSTSAERLAEFLQAELAERFEVTG